MLTIKLISFFLGFWLLRFLYYWNKLKSISNIFNHYILFHDGKVNSFIEKKNSAISLLKEAGIKNFSSPAYELTGFNQGYRHELDGFDNIHFLRDDIAGVVNIKFQEAIGVYKSRMKQSYNPFYWIEFVLKLPEKILLYLSPSVNDSFVKVI
ncbi:MAG: hypothetical protein RLZZ546_2323 [Bacteroidota bacterium]